MIESRCGIKCGSCAYKEQMGCTGCLHIQKPFWGGRLSGEELCGRKKAAALRRMRNVSL